MEIDRIRELRLAHPFRPFDLVLDDGRKLFVRLAYHLAIAPTGDVLLYTGDQAGFETVSTTSVREVIPRKARNGVRGKRGH
jgi:hypothetical protein